MKNEVNNQLKERINVVTFGSCLARRMIERYHQMFGCNLLSRVYHTRTDQFLAQFIDGTLIPVDVEKVSAYLNLHDVTEGEFSRINILKNQVKEEMGLHMLPKGIPFFRAMNECAIDLIIIDNFMDLTAQLREIDGMRFFMKTTPEENKILGCVPPITPTQSIVNYQRIIRWMRNKQPGARIVFAIFPVNTYPKTSGKQEWTAEFLDGIRKIPEINVIPPLVIPKKFQTDERSHFKPEPYYVYAGILRQLLDQDDADKCTGITRVIRHFRRRLKQI